MNRKQWRYLCVIWGNHGYLPESHFWYTGLMRRQDSIKYRQFDKLKAIRPCWRIGSRAKPNGGIFQQVLPVSPIFL